MDARAAALAALHELCDEGSVDLLTLDVFDTLLVRRVARPIDAFVVLGHRLADRGLLPGELTPGAFARLRRLAEDRARDRSAAEGRGVEIALADIYAEIADASDDERRVLVDAELRVERSLCFVDPAIVDLVAAARSAGVAVALVSDTYFSATHLDYLVGGRVAVPGEMIFASSDHGVGKGGGLFDIVLDRVDVEASRAVHAGDNEHADVAAPERVGIRAFHLPRVRGDLAALMVDEGLALPSPQDPAVAPPVLDPTNGDHGLAAMRERAMSIASVGDEAGSAHREIGAGVLGPVFVGFAEWVVDEAAALDASRVYCLMREGALLAPLVDAAAASLGAPIRAVPLWLSRQVAVRAAIGGPDDIDEAVLRRFLVRQRTPTARSLAATLGVPVRGLTNRADADVPLDDVLLANRVIARVLADPQLRRRIADSAAEERARLRRYLAQVLHPDDRDVVVVDLGWNATIQVGFEQALARMGDARRTHGRYLATTREVTGPALGGVRTRGFLVDAGVPEGDGVALFRNPEILEMVTLPAEGSVTAYSESGDPVRGERPVGAEQLGQEAAVREGINTFAAVLARSRALHPELRLRNAAPALRSVLRRLLARPTAREFAAFAGWAHEDNYGSDAATTLGSVDPAVDLAYLTATDLYRLPQRWWWWPAGVVAASAPDVAAAADAMLGGAGPTVAGESYRPEWRVALYVESPLAAGECVTVLGITVNRAGRGLVHLVSVVPEPSSLHCRLDLDAGVAVDRIRTVFAVRGQPDTVVDVQMPDDAWRFEPDDPVGRRTLTYEPDRLPAGSVYRTEVVVYLGRTGEVERV